MPSPEQVEADDRRFGQWSSYVIQLRESLERAERLLPQVQTEAARRTQQRVIDDCRKHLADMERHFPDAG